jgi:Na+/melibiose symporter-like transporter
MYKSLATSLTTFAFIVMGTTGVLMYFHILDNYTKELHEILGLAFVAIIFAHVFFNWKAMRNYFSKKIFYISAGIISAISLGFILNAPTGPDVKRILINSVLDNPIKKTAVLFVDSYDIAKKKLEDSGLVVEGDKSLKEIAMINQTSPFVIIDTILKK